MGKRTYGTVLIGKLADEKNAKQLSKCDKYTIDIEHYSRTGEIICLTEPEEFIPPLDHDPYVVKELPTDSPEVIKERREMKILTPNKPLKEQLQVDMKIMTINQIAEKYGAKPSTVSYWIRGYGLQRKSGPEPNTQKPIKAESRPTMEEIEEFFTDGLDPIIVPKPQDPIEEMWGSVQISLLVLRNAYREEAENKFNKRLNHIINVLDVGGAEK